MNGDHLTQGFTHPIPLCRAGVLQSVGGVRENSWRVCPSTSFLGGYCVLASPHERDKPQPSWLAIEKQRALVFEVLKVDIFKSKEKRTGHQCLGTLGLTQ